MANERMKNISVIGAGAWGTALAAASRRAGCATRLYARETEVAESINAGQGNPVYLKDIVLPDGILASSDLAEAVTDAEAVILVVPAQFLRATAGDLAGILPKDTPVVLAAKGIEQGSLALMSEIAEETLPTHPIAVLSGPSFAAEVARSLPVALTLASADEALGRQLVDTLASKMFRLYQSTDIVGAEIGGAVKNVLAIACGIVGGRGLGDNARAALITRGLAEMVRLGHAKGATTETMMGLAGLGDLVLTCNAMQSRNFSFGHALGQGKTPEEILSERVAVTEGVASAVSVVELAAKLGIDMPICTAVHAIIHQGRDIDTAIAMLMDRPLTFE
ncbi:NAD(P)H-dependent glycerol-3-phosphate dehydrogenase [Thalassospiraceae bacterium LMO-JJ14]|nr:NAD(P)H-dependent glycerol-3-phosphate dehydrogenase [Thalassospiraceae bacterium LMO-JJ14]